MPNELIAHRPAPRRDHSRLMVLHRDSQTIEHRFFYQITDYLQPKDLLVLNDTKVIPGNLVGYKENSGGKVEVLLVKNIHSLVWECLVKPGKRLQVGSRVVFGKGEVFGTVLEKTSTGEQIINFEGDLDKFMWRNGEMPLPPYIHGQETVTPACIALRSNTGRFSRRFLDERYQTVYAKKSGASAAPTAGLHFTKPLLTRIKRQGVDVAHVTLHTGLATFKPVWAENIEDHKMYSEYFEVSAKTVKAVKQAKRVVAVGTTSVRTLEATAVNEYGWLSTNDTTNKRIKGETNLFIYPGYKFKVVDAMVTNFHWPRSTLLMLVSAFAGQDFIRQAYQEAIEKKYRFFSFGDAMLIL